MAKRKTVTMLLTVSVPADMSASDARREVRTLINEQCFYSADEGDLKVRGLKAAQLKTPTTVRRWDHKNGGYVNIPLRGL